MQRRHGLGLGGSGLYRSVLLQQRSKTLPRLQFLSQQAQLPGQGSCLLKGGLRRLGLAGQSENARKRKLRMDDDRAETTRRCLPQRQHAQVFRRCKITIRSFAEGADHVKPVKPDSVPQNQPASVPGLP